MSITLRIGDLVTWRPFGLSDPAERSGRVVSFGKDALLGYVFDAEVSSSLWQWCYVARITHINGEAVAQLEAAEVAHVG